jgi:superfamily II DNA or RNA helicase
MPIIELRLHAAERPSAATAKPSALSVTGAKEQKMSETYRAWQEGGVKTASQLLNIADEKDMSVAAGVGSGKTFFGCGVAEIAMALGRAKKIIVVTINHRCQKQWAKRMKKMGIILKVLNGNGALKDGLPPDVGGYITTYAGMGKFPDLHGAFASGAFVIFDEVHHLNEDENTKWGRAAKDAFEGAEFRLCLSGTFFASNGAPIPFAKMVPRDGANDIFEYNPDVSYSYGDSVADKICRRVIFKPFDGPIEYKRENDDQFKVSTFADDIDPKDIGLRLWSACQPKGLKGQPNMMLEEMLFRANRQLMDLRSAGHERAAGLICCNEKTQARQLRSVIERISGHKAVLVLDDEPGSDKAIGLFEHGFAPWMVAIRMVTEGVDIPRLRVGVYLSNVVQKLTFIQFIGRMVRHFKGDDGQKGDPSGEGYVFFPADLRLREIALAIETEVEAAIDIRKKEKGEGPGTGGGGGLGFYQAGNVHGEERENVIAGAMYSAEEIEAADRLRVQWPNLAEEQILEMVRFVRAARPTPQRAQPSPYDLDDDEDHESIRLDCQKEAQRLARMRNLEFKDAHTAANRAIGIENINTATIEQLKAKRAWLREQIEARENV